MTVQELNKLCKEQETDTPLLSSYDGDFWSTYIANHDDLDHLFVKKYKSMHYFCEEDFTTSSEELTDWLQSIESFLYANDKKYHEMWRIQLLEDSKLSMTENYDMTRTSSTSANGSGSVTSGQRNDYTNNLYGSQESSSQEESTAFNSTGLHANAKTIDKTGTKNDTSTFTQGQQTTTNASQNSETVTSHDVGNLGVQTGADILMSYHKALNSGAFDFYNIVFADICKEFLKWGD